MDFKEMTIEALEARKAEIGPAIDAAESEEEVRTLAEEFDAIKAEMERRKALAAEKAETRKKIASGIEEREEVIDQAEMPQEIEERKNEMTDVEIRKSPEYLDAWVEYQKGRANEEQRALLTENATNGTIAVPVYVQDKIETAWESSEIMRRIRRSYYKGNLKVGYEQSAGPATPHVEGGAAITEENLVIGYVEMIPFMIKKMVRYSDEVLDIKGQAFVDYVFDEIEYQIVKMCEKTVVDMIKDSVLYVSQTLAGATISTADIINAQGKLGGEADNPVLITTRANAASLKAAALSAGYAYDPFDGLEVLYVGELPGTAQGIVVDLSGVQANFPDGDQVKFKFDDISEAAADMIRVIGRLYVAIALVAPGKAVIIETE